MFSPLVRQRLLLAALLWFGSTGLLWTPILSPLDWLTLPGYYAISALLLDLAARFRARDVFALLTLAGIYGLLAALFIHPATALIDMPRTLFTRALGAHALVGLIALVTFLRGRNSLLYLGGALLVGVAAGVWARWSPVELWGTAEPTPLITALSTFAVGVVVYLALSAVAQQPDPPTDYRLSPLGWLIISVIGAALILFHAAQGRIDGVAAITSLVLVGFSTAILWFQKRVKGTMLLDRLPAQRLPGGLLPAVAFFVGVMTGCLLPRTDPDGISILVSLFAAYGVIWLPAVSIVLGWRSFARQARALKL